MRQLEPKKINKVLALLGFCILIGIFYFWNHQQATQLKADVVESVAPNSSKVNAVLSGDTTLAKVAVENVQKLDEVQFRNWIQLESKSLNNSAVNTEEKQIQLKALAQNLTSAQNKKLIEVALDSDADANARILSIFLLTLGSRPENISLLLEAAKKEIPDLGPLNPHSAAELKRGQELALRMMAVDELFERARQNPEALQQLQRLSSEAGASEIRNYAQRKLKELR
ncbi:MAG: hypothetical protein H7328_06415 [Bdellovibrio sp.]|nr:hypothetical protein [Bdellovibrio sp.]